MICPKCSSPDVRTSQQTQWKDHFHTLLGSQAYRCRKCRLRFHAHEVATLTASAVGVLDSLHRTEAGPSLRNRRRLVRRLIMIVIFTAMFVIFWFYLRYLTTDRVAPDTSGISFPLQRIPLLHFATKSSSVVGVDISCLCLSDVRSIYRTPSNANIQPETAGRGNG